MNYATFRTHDVANGPGVRVSLFISGCTHHCKGCFNAEAWDFDYGELYTAELEDKILAALCPDYIKGFSLLGGEPFEPQNQRELVYLLERIKREHPNKTVWCYTGYDFESDILAGALGNREVTDRMICCIDVLVDGKYVEERRDLNLRFRGSSNQRIIDVRRSLECGKVILMKEFY